MNTEQKNNVMKITSKKRNLIIESNGNKIIEIRYKNWLSNKIETEFNGQTIEIKPKSKCKSKLHKNQGKPCNKLLY